MRWSKHRDECAQCGTVELKHHANGLCRTCYTRERTQATGRWPNYLSGCLMCGQSTERANYRSIGLCKRCHQMASRAGVLIFWRAEVEMRRNKSQPQAIVVLQRIAQQIGSQAAADELQLSKKTFRDYATGKQKAPDEILNKAIDTWMGL